MFLQFFSFAPLPHLLKNLIKKHMPSRKLDFSVKCARLLLVPQMYHKCGTCGTYIKSTTFCGTYFTFFTKTIKGGPYNISYFCTFSHIFSLFFNSEIKKIDKLWYIVCTCGTFCGTYIFNQWECLILIMWLGLSNHKGRISTLLDWAGNSVK